MCVCVQKEEMVFRVCDKSLDYIVPGLHGKVMNRRKMLEEFLDSMLERDEALGCN